MNPSVMGYFLVVFGSKRISQSPSLSPFRVDFSSAKIRGKRLVGQLLGVPPHAESALTPTASLTNPPCRIECFSKRNVSIRPRHSYPSSPPGLPTKHQTTFRSCFVFPLVFIIVYLFFPSPTVALRHTATSFLKLAVFSDPPPPTADGVGEPDTIALAGVIHGAKKDGPPAPIMPPGERARWRCCPPQITTRHGLAKSPT